MSDASSKKCAKPSALKQESIVPITLEQSILEQNVRAGKEAEAVFQIVNHPQPNHFYHRLIELCQEKLPKVTETPVPEKYPPFNDLQARDFENSIIPYGKHKGTVVASVPLDYFERLVDDNDFMISCRRYLKSRRYKERKKREE